MKQLPRKDPPDIGGGVSIPCTDPPLSPRNPWPPIDPVTWPDIGNPFPGPDNPPSPGVF